MGKKKSLKGRDLMLWIAGKVVALSTTCKLSLTADTQDSSCKDDGIWGNSEVGKRGWTATNDSIDTPDAATTYDQVFDTLFELYTSDEPVEVTVGVPTNQSDEGLPDAGWTAPTVNCYTGKALITALDREGSNGDNGKISLTLTGVGALKKVADDK
jgi:hypothetical protein